MKSHSVYSIYVYNDFTPYVSIMQWILNISDNCIKNNKQGYNFS